MQSLQKRQLGSTNWAFIIALILLLVFVWLWYDEADKLDQKTAALKAAEDAATAAKIENGATAALLEDLSSAVGWRSKSIRLQHSNRADAQVVYSDADVIRRHFSPDGVVAGAADGETVDGILKRIIGASKLTFEREARLHTTKTGDEKEHKFQTLSADFKQKLADVRAKWEAVEFTRPIPPADPDNEQGKADYVGELQTWEGNVKKYNDALAELAKMEGWTEYTSRIAAPGKWGEPEKVGVTVTFFPYDEGGERTIESAVTNLDMAFKKMGLEITANMAVWGQEVTQLRKDNAAKEDSITAANAALTKEQEAHTNDVNQLQGRITDETERANRNAIRATNAENDAAKVKEDSAKVATGLRREIEARKEQNRLLKEKRDLVIARDDPDGSVLVANGTLRTAVIDLGHKDKAYVGQKFVVSALDRGGNRVNKGEIMVVRVTGDHSAKVRIMSGSAGMGDRIHNPFYEPGERIYVYIAAKLDKWPRAMAAERLAKMNVVVQDAMDGNTQYVIVPNSWAAPAPAAGGDEDEEDGGDGEVAANPLEEIQKQARNVGANVITESLLDAFLDY